MLARSGRAVGFASVLSLLVMVGFSQGAPIQSITNPAAPGNTVLYYGGDYGDIGGQSNNTMLSSQYGSTNLTDFVVGSPGWHVTGLFSNDVKEYGAPPDALNAIWSIRSETTGGSPGPVLYGGTAEASVTATGRPNEYTIAVSRLSLDLKPGTYYMQVSPIADQQTYYVGHGWSNGIGVSGPSGSRYEDRSVVDGIPQDNYGGATSIPASMGVVGEVVVPEPAAWIVFGALLALSPALGSRRSLAGR